MATTTSTHIPIETYLRAIYRPDREYIDGELREKDAGNTMVAFSHGRVLTLLSAWFFRHEEQWGIVTAVEAKTRISDVPVRLPDVVIVFPGGAARGALTIPPLIAIEVFSPSDSDLGLRERAKDLAQMGVKNIWLIDPEGRSAEKWEQEAKQETGQAPRQGSWGPVSGTRLEAEDSPIFLDLAWLWQQFGARP